MALCFSPYSGEQELSLSKENTISGLEGMEERGTDPPRSPKLQPSQSWECVISGSVFYAYCCRMADFANQTTGGSAEGLSCFSD